tara:strand:- start:1134 stop:1448 length:315 start_codon:yes stop_codon:yes gene_type:complete
VGNLETNNVGLILGLVEVHQEQVLTGVLQVQVQAVVHQEPVLAVVLQVQVQAVAHQEQVLAVALQAQAVVHQVVQSADLIQEVQQEVQQEVLHQQERKWQRGNQ